MLATANKLDGTQPTPGKRVIFWECVNTVIWLAIFIGAAITLAGRFSDDAPDDLAGANAVNSITHVVQQ